MRAPENPKIWRTRGFIPHFDLAGELQHIVFRLADSLPAGFARALENVAPHLRLERAEAELDGGAGSRALADPRVARLVSEALLHFDRRRYESIAWCVMPTHVHVLARQLDGFPLAAVVHTWKSYTANAANRLLGRTGTFWAREYFDRAMRSDGQAERAFGYIEGNPVSAGLCATPTDWAWGSAGWKG